MVGDIGKNCRLHIKPALHAGGASGTTGHKARALVYTLLDQRLNFVKLNFVDNRADVTAAFMGWSHLDDAGHVGCGGHRLIIDLALDKHPRRGVA